MEAQPDPPDPPRGLKEMVEHYERELILKALAESGGHQRRAARALGVLPSTLSEKMRRLNLRPARAGSAPSTRREAALSSGGCAAGRRN